MKKKKGFTLIELLVVIAILAVILLIAVPIIVSNIDKSKVKSYDNQVSLFVEGSRRYALEYSNDLVWEDTEIEGVKKAEVTLRELAEKDYVDLPVTNPKTGEPFDPDNTKVIIYKDKDGNLEFEYEDEDGFSLVIGSKTQTILQTTVYNKQMIMNDVYGKDASNNDITSKVTYTCRYGTEDIDCNTLSSTTKNIGTYYITYRLESGNKTKTATRRVDVVSKSRPIIEVRPENMGTKVDSVRVTIIYPEGATSKIYSTKDQKNKTYTIGFDVNENQTITADCIDKNGLQCETATKVIDYIKPTIEVDDPNKGIVIAASWPNTTSMTLDLSGVSIVKGDGSIEYKCRVGTKETAWSNSTTCNITGLQQGTAYTVKVSARNKKNTSDIVEKTTTIYTSKEVIVAAKTEVGTCPANTNTKIAATDIYEEKEVSGTCTNKSYTCNASKTLSSSTNNLPATTQVSCSGATSIGTGGTLTSTSKIVSCTIASSTSTGTATCGNRPISCTIEGVTITSTQGRGTCTSATSSCNLTSTIASSTACGGTKTSVCNGKTVTMASGCTTTQVPTTYTCTAPSSTSTGTAACGNRTASCTTNGITITSTQGRGTCTSTTSSCNLTSTIASSTACGGAKTSVCNGKTVTMASNCTTTQVPTTYSCTVSGSTSTGTAACGNRPVSCTTNGMTITSTQGRGTCTSTTSSCNLSSSSTNTIGCGGTKTSVCNGKNITMTSKCTSRENNITIDSTCSVNDCKSVPIISNKCLISHCGTWQINPAGSGSICTYYVCDKEEEIITGYRDECTSINVPCSGTTTVRYYTTTYSYSSSWISKYTATYPQITLSKAVNVPKYTTKYNYSSSWISKYTATYPQVTLSKTVNVPKYTTTYNYSSSWISKYTATYPQAVLSSNKITGYYKTYTANNIVYKREHTITYTKVIVKPKQTIY